MLGQSQSVQHRIRSRCLTMRALANVTQERELDTRDVTRSCAEAQQRTLETVIRRWQTSEREARTVAMQAGVPGVGIQRRGRQANSARPDASKLPASMFAFKFGQRTTHCEQRGGSAGGGAT